MQNSLSRLLEGIAHALHHDILPSVEDDYARAQLTACIEILGNLEPRISWDPQVLVERAERIRATIVGVADELPADPELAEVHALAREDADLADLAGLHRALGALADLQGWLGDRPGEPANGPIAELVAADLHAELGRLRTARFGR